MERFLYRLSRSEHVEHFVLKGALMLQLWGGPVTRATKDIDLLGRASASVEELTAVVRSCLAVVVEDDGLQFDRDSVSGDEIRLAANYDGVRIRCNGRLGNARVNLQIDVGFGDVVTPGAQELEYLRKGGVDGPVPPLHQVAADIETFVMPIVEALGASRGFTSHWSPGGPWKDRAE